MLYPYNELLFDCSAGSSSADELIGRAYEEADRDAEMLDRPSCLVGIFTSRESVDTAATVAGLGLNSIGTVASVTILTSRDGRAATLCVTGVARVEIIDEAPLQTHDPRVELATSFFRERVDIAPLHSLCVNVRILDGSRPPQEPLGRGVAVPPFEAAFGADLKMVAECFREVEPRFLPRTTHQRRSIWTSIASTWERVHSPPMLASTTARASVAADDDDYVDDEFEPEYENWNYAGDYLLASGSVDAGMICDFIARTLQLLNSQPLSVDAQQVLLETVGIEERLELLKSYLIRLREALSSDRREADIGDANTTIMRCDADHTRQLLGEYAGSPAGGVYEAFRKKWVDVNEQPLNDRDRLFARIDSAGLPDEVEHVARRELARLARLQATDADYSKSIDYLDLLLDLPWRARGGKSVSLGAVRSILNGKCSGLDEAKRRVVEYMAVVERKRQRHEPAHRGPILCLAGPPGVGKTSLAQGVADALGHGVLVRVSCGGMRDEVEIRGHNRTYIGSQPGQIIREMRRVGIRTLLSH